ncbi:cytochrome P450 [Scenedesmus sp. NREL 46B-D3]|nr:cytochrome P450 [Scenedesmus sp. NREL 46B-D3]
MNTMLSHTQTLPGSSCVTRAKSPSAGRTCCLIARAATNTAGSAATRSITALTEGVEASGCPFTALKSQLTRPSAKPDQKQADVPGPAPFSFESLGDVGTIFFEGLHVAMLKFSQKYGPVCRFANPASLNAATSWVFLNSPENIQHVCATNVKNYNMRYLPDIYKYVTHEKGLLGSQGEYNARHRRLCQPPFRNRAQLERFADVVVQRSARLAEIWQQHLASCGSSFLTDVATQTQRLTLDVVGLTAFSHDFKQVQRIADDLSGAAGDSTQATDRLLWAVNAFGESLAEVFITPMPLLRLAHALGLPHLRNLDEAVGIMRGAMLGVIQERRVALSQGAAVPQDLLGILLAAADESGQAMTDEELWEDVHDVMGAGHETTATTTAAALYCISAHPVVEARLMDELQRVLGGRPPAYADLEQLPYLQACIKEVMRLYPAIPVFPREAAADDVLPSQHPVSKGDVVFMSSYALGRSPAIWPDPLTFDPSRFSAAAEAAHHRFQFLPFGAGARMCLGAGFAQMSVALMVASLLQKFEFEPVTPASPLIPVTYDITMNFNETRGLHMRVAVRGGMQQQQRQQQEEEEMEQELVGAAVAAAK